MSEVIRTYENIKTEAMSLRKKEDGCSWSLGDLTVELDDLLNYAKNKVKEATESGEVPNPEYLELTRTGKELIKRLANDIGVGVEYLDARRRVSLRIPKEGPLSWIRDSSLSFTHCRALYPIKDDSTLDTMAQKGLTLTVEQLRNEVAVLHDDLNIKSGLYSCSFCDAGIDSMEDMFSVRKGTQKTLLCSLDCLIQWGNELLEVSNGNPIDISSEEEELVGLV